MQLSCVLWESPQNKELTEKVNGMQKQEIEISVLPDGRIEYTIKGVQGSACESISALLEQLGKIEQQEKTSDYYAQEPDVLISVSNE